ncbi:hypothetical protein D3C87_2138380 [compost metagenome]
MQPEGRMLPAQRNQPFVVFKNGEKPPFVLPADGVNRVGTAVAVVVTVFAAQKLITGLQERNPL